MDTVTRTVYGHIEIVPFGRFTMSRFEGQSCSYGLGIVYRKFRWKVSLFVNRYNELCKKTVKTLEVAGTDTLSAGDNR